MSVQLVSDALAEMSAASDVTGTPQDSGIHDHKSASHPDTSKSSLDTSFQPPDCHSSPMLLSTPANATADADEMYRIDQHNLHQMLLLDAAALHSRSTAAISLTARANSGDAGSDSGVEIADLGAPLAAGAIVGPAAVGAAGTAACSLQRALSSTSGGYGSSSGGLDEPLNQSGGASCNGAATGAGSCNSSMISYCSELEGGGGAAAESAPTGHRSATNGMLRHSSQLDCTSEGGSESSSITGGPVHRKSSIVRKKVALIEPPASALPSRCGRKDDNSVARSRARTASANRTALQTKCPAAAASPPALLANGRARSRDKVVAAATISSSSNSRAAALPPSSRSTPLKRSATIGKQDSVQSPRTPLVARTPSISRATGRVSSGGGGLTPTHGSAGGDSLSDGRWPSVSTKCQTPHGKPHSATGASSAHGTPEHLIIKTKVGPICLAADASGPDSKAYATLPRRRKEKSDEDLHTRMQRSSSAQRDRMATSLVKRQLAKELADPKVVSGRPSAVSTPSRRSTLSGIRFAPAAAVTPPSATMPKTKIYHEISIQTALTGDDVCTALAGLLPASMMRPVDAVATEARACQVDIRDTEIEALHEQLRRARDQVTALQSAVGERGQQLLGVEQQLARERDEKLAMTQELQSNTQRILGMLALVQHSERPVQAADAGDAGGGADSLLMLESQIQLSGHALEAKQCEIEKLYGFCRTLQLEMQRSMSVQRSLLEEKNELEKESTELQDFLQDEKTTLVDALRDAEAETERSAALVAQRDVDIERLQEECRHLVRISEQRR